MSKTTKKIEKFLCSKKTRKMAGGLSAIIGVASDLVDLGNKLSEAIDGAVERHHQLRVAK